MADKCESGRHGEEKPDASRIVEYTGHKFGGTEEKALCQECIDLMSKSTAGYVILNMININS